MSSAFIYTRPSSPLALPLVQASDNTLAYLGNIPISGFDFEFGGAAMSINGNELYMTGLRTDQTLGSLTLPTSVSSGSAATSVTPVSVAGSIGEPSGQVCLTGSLVYGGELYITKSIDYDGDDDQNAWIKKATLSVGSQGAMNSMTASNGATERRLSQCLGHIPAEWQDVLGGPAFTCGGRMSVISHAQCGYGFGVFDPADVSTSAVAVPVTVLLDYPYGTNGDTALEPGDAGFSGTRPVDGLTYSTFPKNGSGATDLFTSTNAPLGTAFIHPGSRSLIFITCHGYGTQDNGCRPGSSVNNSPFRIQVVAYDLADLVDVKNGVLQTWEPQPYAWWELPDSPYGGCVGAANSGSYHGNFCWLPNYTGGQNWLIGLADGAGGSPTLDQIQVWTVASL